MRQPSDRGTGGSPVALHFKPLLQAGTSLVVALMTFTCASVLASDQDTPENSRTLYNDGTQKLRNGKLREAEATLQTAVARNDGAVQTVALYNLAHVRFQQGVETLKDAPNGAATKQRGDNASAAADGALQIADEALAGYDLDAIVSAYMHGRGVRKEMKKARAAVICAASSKGILGRTGADHDAGCACNETGVERSLDHRVHRRQLPRR